MLFAPKAGADLRTQVTEQAGRLRTTANDAYSQASEKVSQMVDRGREAYEKARTNTGGINVGGPSGSGPSTGSGGINTPSGVGTSTGGYGTGGYGSDRG
jgi:hypothetical protein